MQTMATTEGRGERLWVPGDWNAFFGFGPILPAPGLMLFLSTGYYAYLGYRLAKKTGRDDVCALPSGISVPHMFVVTFVVMLPIALKTGDPEKGWQAGLVW